ncbi:hypothetical protein JCM8547_004375 [Rhodosporidiobolus lusitaniae]
MRLRPASAVLVSVWSATSALAGWDCKLLLNGNTFDLNKLNGVHEWEDSVQTPPTATKTRYSLSLCSALPPPSSSSPEDDCPAGTRLCLKTFSSRSGLEDRLLSVVPVAAESGSGGEFEARANPWEGEGEKAEGAWVLELGGGSYSGKEQKAKVEMRCDEKATETTPTEGHYDPSSGLLTLKWRTAAACSSSSSGDGDSTPPPSEPDKDKEPEKDDPTPSRDEGGMGFFAWFFTLLVLGFFAYLAIGIWKNYTEYGATGWDAVPHRDVWRDLPYVVVDLFKGRGGSRGGYSSLS